MPTMPDHLSLLPRTLRAEWAASAADRPAVLADHVPRSSFTAHQIVDPAGVPAYSWGIAPLYGCLVIGVSAEVKVREDFRRHGVATYMRGVRTRAMRRAGFRAEICTVRVDNEAMSKIMARSGAEVVATLPSDKGGEINLWRTELPEWDGVALPDLTTGTPHTVLPMTTGYVPIHYVDTLVAGEQWTVMAHHVTCPECREALPQGASSRAFWQFERRPSRVSGTRDLLWVEASDPVIALSRATAQYPNAFREGIYRDSGGIRVTHVSGDSEAVIVYTTNNVITDIPARRPHAPGTI